MLNYKALLLDIPGLPPLSYFCPSLEICGTFIICGKKYLYVYGMCIGIQQIHNKKKYRVVYNKENESNISLFETQLYKLYKQHKGSAFLLSFCCLFILFFNVDLLWCHPCHLTSFIAD